MVLIKYYIDGVPYYLHNGKQYTQEEVDKLTDKIRERDKAAGYRDRIAGFYDKWYRYNRKDKGKAYDAGVKEAMKHPYCAKKCHIIPCC